MIVALVALAVVCIGLAAALVAQHAADARRITRLLDQLAAERLTWSQERWDLNTRLANPNVIPAPPTPAPPQAGAAPAEPDEDDVDELHLVGMVAPNPANAS